MRFCALNCKVSSVNIRSLNIYSARVVTLLVRKQVDLMMGFNLQEIKITLKLHHLAYMKRYFIHARS